MWNECNLLRICVKVDWVFLYALSASRDVTRGHAMSQREDSWWVRRSNMDANKPTCYYVCFAGYPALVCGHGYAELTLCGERCVGVPAGTMIGVRTLSMRIARRSRIIEWVARLYANIRAGRTSS